MWVKDGVVVDKKTEGANLMTKQAWETKKNKVWVKDGKKVEEGTVNTEQEYQFIIIQSCFSPI